MAYQDDPRASKSNAFCWQTWRPQVNLQPQQASAQISARQTGLVEERRAQGVDMLHLPGMGSSARHDPTAVAARAIQTARRSSKGKRRA